MSSHLSRNSHRPWLIAIASIATLVAGLPWILSAVNMPAPWPIWLHHPGTWLATLGAPGILLGLFLHQKRPLTPEVSDQSGSAAPSADPDTEAALHALTAALHRLADGDFSPLDLPTLPPRLQGLGAALARTHTAVSHAQDDLNRCLADCAESPDTTQSGSYGRNARQLAAMLVLIRDQDAVAARLQAVAASGEFQPRLGATTPLAAAAEQLFAEVDSALHGMVRMSDALARGNLTDALPEDHPGVVGETCRSLNGVASNLRETIGRINAVVATVTDAARQIAEGNRSLAARTQEQAAHLEETASSMEEINAVVQQNAETAASVMAFVDQATAAAEHSSEEMAETSRSIGELAANSRRVEDIVGVIDSLAFQTNILALNAAVEAARAGEHGRGFAVVASEVRQLSLRSSDAAQDIRKLISGTAAQTAAAIQRVDRQARTLGELIATIHQIHGHMRDIRSASAEQATGLSQISQAIMRIDDATQQTTTLVDDAAASTRQLYGQAKGLHHLVEEFELGAAGERAHAIHSAMPKIVQDAARAIARVWENALASGQIDEAALFDEDYREYGNSNPPKYHTRFDTLADQLLPAIQEPLLRAHGHITYAIACDHNGYVPTHNAMYCEPLTGDPSHDKTHNRTKRIFSDAVGSRCGRHPLPFLLQTYRRDTGEIVHDISAPVFVKGRRWGGFRIGYKTAAPART